MVRYALLCGGSAIAVAASLYGTQAVAATAAASDTAQGAATVGELVVVAEKREAKIESVPVAITAYSSEQRKLMGIEIVQDLANFTPSLVWTDINDRIFIRGIGRNSDNLNNTSGVAIYYNGLYYGANASVELQKDDLFIGNIEVDAGPQNTLHGSNSDGGVVNFISQRPTDSLYAEGRFGFQNLSEEFAEGVVSGPINDHLKFRFGGNFTIQRGGNFVNFDGPPQGGGLVLGGGGNTEYLEFQLQGHWDHFDTWTMVSSGNFAANSKGTDALGTIPTTLLNGGISSGLVPTDFYGLCGLPGVIGSPNGAGCAGGPAVVSVTTLPVTANRFPGNDPGNVNPREFIQEFNSINNQQRNVQVSEDATWHAEDFDVQYLGSYQQFHYILEFPGATDGGVTSYTLAGLNPANGTGDFFCGSAGFTLASCEQPLKIVPAPNFTLFNEYDQSFSHEINIISTWASPLQYVGGLYWWHEHWNQPVDAGTEPGQPQMGAPQYINLGNLSLSPAPLNPSFAASTENTEINYNSYAAYGQVSYKFNDNWKVSGALRYTDDDKKGWQEWRLVVFDGGVLGPAFSSTSYGANTPALDITALATAASLGHAFPGAGPASIQASTGFAIRTLHLSNGALTGEADVDWTPDPSLLVYGKYSRGYKSGGWSTYTLGANPETQPEYVDAFELGAKKSTGSYTINADVFYYNYYNEQTPLTIQDPVTKQLIPELFNIPLVHDYGFEMAANWRATDDLIFNLTYSYLNATVANSPCVEDTVDPLATQPAAKVPIGAGGCYATPALLAAAQAAGAVAQNIKGEAVPSATPNKISFNTLYTLHFEPGNLTLSGTLVWKDGTYYDVFNRPYNFAPDYAVLNLRAVWADAKDRYNIILFMNNVANTIGYDGSAGDLMAGGSILTTQALIAPREYGIQFQFRFK